MSPATSVLNYMKTTLKFYSLFLIRRCLYLGDVVLEIFLQYILNNYVSEVVDTQ
jgi:hypothetical protein